MISRRSSSKLKNPQLSPPQNGGGLPEAFRELTPRQAQFVIHYALTRNGVEAARQAGYTGNDHTIRQIAHENMTKPDILKAFDAYLRPHFESAGVSVARTIQHLADLAYAPWGDSISIKEKNGRIVSATMQLSAKVKALEILLKVQRVLGVEDNEAAQRIDQSHHVHLHKHYATADEARQALLDYLKKR